jgi:hypothetical protein
MANTQTNKETAMRFENLTRRQQVAHLHAYGLSSQCVAYLLDVPHAQVRPHYRALGLVATVTAGGRCVGMGKAAIVRALTALGMAAPVVAHLAACKPHYVAAVLARPALAA